MDEQQELTALYPCQVEMEPLMQSLREAGVSDDQISLMTPLPLSGRGSVRLGIVPLYVVTIIAGFVGVGIGVFFAGGTAIMYPLMTGGKPIVGAPIVGIISYETMMLSAIVVTFLTSILTIKLAHRTISERDSRVDDGYVMVAVRVPSDNRTPLIRGLLQRAGAVEVRLSDRTSSEGTEGNQRGNAVAVTLAALCLLNGCSRDMQEQPSYGPQEAPRLHSPLGAVPRDSRAIATVSVDASISGADLFRINCAHCHGSAGRGDGPAAAYLKEKPVDLHKPEVQRLSDSALYEVLTRGKDVMPSFRGELSANERRSIVVYVKSLPIQQDRASQR